MRMIKYALLPLCSALVGTIAWSAQAAPSHTIASVNLYTGSSQVNEAFWVDAYGELWGSECLTCNWDFHGYPSHNGTSTHIVGGISTVSQQPGVAEAWVIGQDGRLYIRWLSNGSWLWSDQGMPSCGTLVGNPAASAFGTTSNGYLGGVMLCSNGDLVERYWDNYHGVWTWIDHGHPSGVSFVGDPGFAANTHDLVAGIRDSGGNMWVLEFDPTHGSSAWTNVGNPSDAFMGSPGMYSTPGALIGGLVTTASGQVQQFFLWGSSWLWYNLGAPAGCPPTGDMTVTSDPSNNIYALPECNGNTSVGRISFVSGSWGWRVTSSVGSMNAQPQITMVDDAGTFYARAMLHYSNSNVQDTYSWTYPGPNSWYFENWDPVF